MPSYKILLNILILFLCTSCCACGDCSDTVDIFYLRILEDRENVISKYELGGTNDFFKPNKVYFTTQEDIDIDAFIYVRGDYLSVRMNTDYTLTNGSEYKLWVKDKVVGNFFIKIKLISKNVLECCGSAKLQDFESRTDSITITKKPQEEKQPFYEIQY